MTTNRLGVVLNHVASLRQARRAKQPDPVVAAALAEQAGADAIIVQLREDRRHIQERDVRLLRQTVTTGLTLRMAATQEMLKLAYDIKPDCVTLLPERADEVTAESGLDIGYHRDHIRKYVQNLRDGDIAVSIFVDPDIEQIRDAHRVEASGVVLDARKYAEARGRIERNTEKQRLSDAARAATKLGIVAAVGHGLNFQNVQALTEIEVIEEFQVGHSLISRSLLCGLDKAVRDMRQLIQPQP